MNNKISTELEHNPNILSYLTSKITKNELQTDLSSLDEQIGGAKLSPPSEQSATSPKTSSDTPSDDTEGSPKTSSDTPSDDTEGSSETSSDAPSDATEVSNETS